jgi:hypothetical protein
VAPAEVAHRLQAQVLEERERQAATMADLACLGVVLAPEAVAAELAPLEPMHLAPGRPGVLVAPAFLLPSLDQRLLMAAAAAAVLTPLLGAVAQAVAERVQPAMRMQPPGPRTPEAVVAARAITMVLAAMAATAALAS